MSAALGVSTCDTDRRTLTGDDRKADLVTGFVQFDTLNTSSYLVGFPRIVVVRVVEEIDVFQMMSPDAECTCTS